MASKHAAIRRMNHRYAELQHFLAELSDPTIDDAQFEHLRAAAVHHAERLWSVACQIPAYHRDAVLDIRHLETTA